jgi:cytochrome P450
MIASRPAEVLSPAYFANPYPTLAYLRENEPVHLAKDPQGNPFWLLTRYDDALALLKDQRFSKKPIGRAAYEDMMPLPKMLKPFVMPLVKPLLNRSFGPLMNNMLDLDDPDHSRLRSLVHKAFTPRLLATMQIRIEAISNALIDAALAKGQMEFINDFAFPLPITVIAEILGVPSRDHAQFRLWSNSLISTHGNGNMFTMMQNVNALIGYIKKQLDERRSKPQDDLMTALVQVEEAGEMLKPDELVAMCVLLLTAGHETTVNLLGNGLFALLKHPEQFDLLRRNPEFVKTAIEEFLRYDSPVHNATERYAMEDLEISGVRIARGDKVLAGLAAANHDPRQFPNPETFDICRENNRHLSFGQGIHYCVGAPLARMEGQIAFSLLLERLPDMRLAKSSESLEYRPNMFLRGLKELPVRF